LRPRRDQEKEKEEGEDDGILKKIGWYHWITDENGEIKVQFSA